MRAAASHLIHFEELLLTAAMPVRLSLYFVGDGACVEPGGSVLGTPARRARTAMLQLLHVETILVADLLAEGCG